LQVIDDIDFIILLTRLIALHAKASIIFVKYNQIAINKNKNRLKKHWFFRSLSLLFNAELSS